jgi:hypothetical protein
MATCRGTVPSQESAQATIVKLRAQASAGDFFLLAGDAAVRYVRCAAGARVTTAKRSEALEYRPIRAYGGVGVPKKTPTEIVEKFNIEINAVLADPKLKARFIELGVEPMMTPAAFEKFVVAETETWAKAIRVANIKL